MARRALLVGGACLLAGVGGPSLPASATTAPTWLSFSADAHAAAVRVVAVEPGGPFAGPNDRIADLTAFAAEAESGELASTAHAVGAFHGNEGVIPAVRGIGPSKVDSTLAPTPLGGLPVEPPSTLPLEAFASYPSHPKDDATAATARASASTELGHAAGFVTSNPDSGVVHSAATSDLNADGVLAATASTVIEGAAFGPVTIARVASSASARQTPGERVQRTTTLAVAGLAVGDDAIAVERTTDTTVRGVRVRVIAAQDDATGTTAPVLEVSFTAPQSLAGSGETHVVYRFGAAVAHVDGVIETPRDSTADVVTGNSDMLALDLGVDTYFGAPPTLPFVAVADDQAMTDVATPRRPVATPDASSSRAFVVIAVAVGLVGPGLLLALRQRRRRLSG